MSRIRSPLVVALALVAAASHGAPLGVADASARAEAANAVAAGDGKR